MHDLRAMVENDKNGQSWNKKIDGEIDSRIDSKIARWNRQINNWRVRHLIVCVMFNQAEPESHPPSPSSALVGPSQMWNKVFFVEAQSHLYRLLCLSVMTVVKFPSEFQSLEARELWQTNRRTNRRINWEFFSNKKKSFCHNAKTNYQIHSGVQGIPKQLCVCSHNLQPDLTPNQRIYLFSADFLRSWP